MNTIDNTLRAIQNPYDTCDIHCLKSIDKNKGKATNKPTTPNRIEREYEKPLANIMPHGVPYSVPEMNRARGRKLRRQEPDHNPNSSLICKASNGSLLAYRAIRAYLTVRDIGMQDIRKRVTTCRLVE
jgi:hypothetical protein